ncbi:MAG TPA: ribosome-associated translation inhibitor RaiA [Candidatus Kerfeldbacteria bacterium]|nr:MAG: Sigma 54 modulation protein/ribosomal protein S30EA [Parcubacteria group bacterium GW2011_GWA2_48_9]KKW16343.1 MAG: Sigma 54 modulation protein/ribosomal protein S30EA [Parcubacteria group bacterium GW2011_GWC2_49_9]HCJ52627.1 ribosome-associated translation inhibitor RaiA [Candidatus Kerfeldbacteria bacterium]HCM68332.1 ribosome-associated translation inhibitor RaiA [Candidatus Kerfeldbacteria bacterium]
MNIMISGKDFSLTPALKAFVEIKIQKLFHLAPSIQSAKVELDVDRNKHKGDIFRAEISVVMRGTALKAGDKSEHMQSAILRSIEKLSRRVTTLKEKNISSHKRQ